MKKIKEILTKLNNQKLIVIVLLILVIAGAFYWYEWRPSQAYKFCTKKQLESIKQNKYQSIENLKFLYSICLSNKGI